MFGGTPKHWDRTVDSDGGINTCTRVNLRIVLDICSPCDITKGQYLNQCVLAQTSLKVEQVKKKDGLIADMPVTQIVRKQ